MKKSILVLAAVLFAFAGMAHAQAPVNIVYPIDGGTYPITNPAPGPLESAYFTSSFSVTCQGGPYNVRWGFDSTTIGSAVFYDEYTTQFTHKLKGGDHLFWVISDCGESRVSFRLGN